VIPSTPAPAQQPAPHQLANELTSDSAVQDHGGLPETRRDGPATRVEKNVSRLLLLVGLGAVIIGLVLAAIIFKQWLLIALGSLFVIPFVLLVSAPVWLASATKAAQDQTVREQRGLVSEPNPQR
jgi:hypothetical protein